MQLPDNSAHEVELNAPPTFPSLQDTVPAGTLGELEVSVIFTINDIEEPGCAGTRFGVIVPDVGSTVTTFTVLLFDACTELLLEFVLDCKV